MKAAKGAPIAFGALIVVSLLYPTIYLHELGHASVAHLLGCKADWYSVDLHAFLLGSVGGDIDYACLRAGNRWAVAAVDGAGISINLLVMAAAWAAAARAAGFARFWLLGLAAVNYLEAFSYLVGNAILPRSDMIEVLAYFGIPNLVVALGAGAMAAAIAAFLYPALATALKVVLPTARVRRTLLMGSILIVGAMLAGRMSLIDGAQSSSEQTAD